MIALKMVRRTIIVHMSRTGVIIEDLTLPLIIQIGTHNLPLINRVMESPTSFFILV